MKAFLEEYGLVIVIVIVIAVRIRASPPVANAALPGLRATRGPWALRESPARPAREAPEETPAR